MKELLAVFGMVIIVIVGFILGDAYRCMSRAQIMKFNHSYGPFQGCMIETKQGWVDIDHYRVMQ